MIIGFDANEANVANRVGVGWFVYYLLHQFQKQASAKLCFRIFLKSPKLEDLPKQNQYFKYYIVPKKSLWSQVDLPIALYLRHRDLSVFLSPAHYSPRFCPCPTVVVVHDLAYFYYPQDFLAKDLYQLLNWTKYSVQKAAKIIAVSALTKEDIILNYQVPDAKVSVIHNGFGLSKTNIMAPNFVVKQPFFLYIGTLQPRKNLKNLVLGFWQFLQTYPNYYLYIVGKKGWLYKDIYSLVKNYKLTDKVIFTDYLPEDQKNYLLSLSQGLIMPGLYEGFGLPVLEAFSAGIPVICSSSGALPETAKEAALYFDPTKPTELAGGMSKFVTDTKFTDSLIAKGHEVLKNYSWQKTAKQVISIALDIFPKKV